MVPLHHPAVRLRLAGLDHLILVVGDEELKAVLWKREGRAKMGAHCTHSLCPLSWALFGNNAFTGSETKSKNDVAAWLKTQIFPSQWNILMRCG